MRVVAAWIILLHLAGAATARATESSQLEVALDNGLYVLVRGRPQQTLVTVDVIYAAGAATEPDSLPGLAHFAEHLLCKGELRRRLALLALESNASTHTPTMAFSSTCLPSLLPRILDVEADRMRGVPLDSLGFIRERHVVLEELAYRGGYRETSPRAVAFRAAFPGHPFGRSPGGTAASVSRILPADIRDFVALTIHPGAALLVIDGPVDPQAVLAMVTERFAAIAPGPPRVPLPPYPEIDARQAVFDDRDHVGYRIAAVVRVPLPGPAELVLADLTAAYLRHEGVGADLATIPLEGVISFEWYGDYHRPSAELAGLYPFAPDQDIQRSLAWRWESIADAAKALGAGDRRAELEAWLREAAARRRTPPSSGWLPGTVLRADSPLPTVEEYARLAAAVTLGDIRDFLVKNIRPACAAIAVSHGRDSERIASRALAGRVARHGEVLAPDALDGLTVAEIEPVLRAYADADALPLVVFRLANGVPVVCRHLQGARRWILAGWRHLEPIAMARPGKRAGICRLYGMTAAYDPRPSRDGRPPWPWRHEAEFVLRPDGLFSFAASGACAEATDVASALVDRLDESGFNITVWAAALRIGSLQFPRLNLDAENRAAAWRWSRVLGAKHPAVAMWQPDPATPDDVKYEDLEKLHRQVAGSTGATFLLACGGVPADSVRTVLESNFGRRDRWVPLAVGPPPDGPMHPAGTIVPASTASDVTLVLTFGAVAPGGFGPHPGLMILLLEELLDQVLDSRLRQREGWTYDVDCSFAAVGGWAVPEVTVTCQPGQAPSVLAKMREELTRLASTGFTEDSLALARLRIVGRLLRAGTDSEGLVSWLRFVTAFGPVPEDPVAAALALDPGAAGVEPSGLVPADRFVFSAVGAILEDDLELFLR